VARVISFREYLLDIMLAKFHNISDTKWLTEWGVQYLLDHDMGSLLPRRIQHDIATYLEVGVPIPGSAAALSLLS
jgi:hypothetical protein